MSKEFKFPSVNSIKISEKEIQEYLRSIAKDAVLRRKVMNKLCDEFASIEAKGERVADIVMNAESFSILRKYGSDNFEASTKAHSLKRGYFGMIWGAFVWVQRTANGVSCYPENSKTLLKKFPFIKESKNILKNEDYL